MSTGRRRQRSRFSAALGTMLLVGLWLGACGGGEDSDRTDPMNASDGSFDSGRLAEPFRPDASCEVVIETPALQPASHVPEGTAITYNSNPPSSGPHYPIWANFQEYSAPVELPYLVHSLEHGAIVLLYKPCADSGPVGDGGADADGGEVVDGGADADGGEVVDGGADADGGAMTGACAETLRGLRAVRDSLPTDPACDPQIRVRVIIAPEPSLDVPVAAAAWGWTYKAACLDEPTLRDFARAHYGHGPEDLCAVGRTF